MIGNCWWGAAGADAVAMTLLTRSASCADRFNDGYADYQKDVQQDVKRRADTSKTINPLGHMHAHL